MAKHVVSLELSPQGVTKAIREVQAYQKEFLHKIELLMNKIAYEGSDILRYEIVSTDAVMFGELLASVSAVYSGGVAIISMGTDHAAFVEFGTGSTGAANPHPEPPGGWKYDVNARGEKGWWYFGDWDGNWHWTKGMPSRPVMWNTSQQIPDLVAKLAKEVFS